MGGAMTSSYSVERFIKELCENNYDIQDTQKVVLNEKLDELLKVFTDNKNAYKEYKKYRKEIDEQEGKREINYDDESIKFEIKSATQKFSACMCFCIQINKIFLLNYPDLYLTTLKIMYFLIDEIDFIKVFMTISADKIANIISTKDTSRYDERIYEEITIIILSLTETFTKKNLLRDDQLNNIRKIMTVPKKLNDQAFCKKVDLKKNLLKIFKNSLLLVKDLYEASKDPNQVKKKEYKDFVRSTISEFNNSTIFKMVTDMILVESDSNIQMDIIDSLFYLCHLDFVLIDQYIKYEKEVKDLTNLIDNKSSDGVLIGIIKFMIIYHKNSFSLSLFQNFKLFLSENHDIEERLYKIFETTNNEDLALYICLLFVCISILEEVWDNLKIINIIAPTSKFLYAYISKTFQMPFDEGSNETKDRLRNVSLIIDILGFLTKDKVSNNFTVIFHTDIYKYYCDVVILLYKIFHPSFRVEILNIMSVFSYYYDCKARILAPDNSELIELTKKRIIYLYDEMRKLNQIFVDCSSSKQSITDLCGTISVKEIKRRYEENIALFENTQKNTRNLFISVIEDLNQLLSFFVNLMIGNDYSVSIRILTKNAPDPSKEKFFVDLENIYKEVVDEELLRDIFTVQNSTKIINYQSQLEVALIMVKPKGSIAAIRNVKGLDKLFEDTDERSMFKYLISKMKEFINDHDVLHKYLFAINRFISKLSRLDENKDSIRILLEDISFNIYGDGRSTIVNRELLRILCILTMFPYETMCWLKLDSKKLHIDNANFSDFLLKINKDVEEFDQDDSKLTDEQAKRVIFPPFKRIPVVRQKLGAIFYHEHVLILPKRLDLSKSFTITFFFYNPVPNTERYHTLLQDSTGIGGLIVIDTTRKKIGCFSVDGEFVDSGFDLGVDVYDQKWIFFALSYQKIGDSTKIYFNLDCKQENAKLEEKIILPTHVQYIGNCRDYDEPFGAICDLRIYKNFYNKMETIERIRNSEEKVNDDIFLDIHKRIFEDNNFMDKFLSTKDNSEETFLYTIKFVNNLMSKSLLRNRFINYEMIMKILKFYKSKKLEIKKEISKFLQSIN